MKKWMLLSIMLGAMPLSMMAQDDMYFVPKKSNASAKQSTASVYDRPSTVSEVTHSGSWRSVDEYNRRGVSSYEELPVDTGDVVTFSEVEGVYPDSVGDFSVTKRMSRFDDYTPSAEYWDGYVQGRNDAWGWHSPWYYSAYYPWYDPWYYDPWYYDPWYYSSWHNPWYWNHGWGWGWYGSYYHPWHYGYCGYWGGGYVYHHPSHRYDGGRSIAGGTRDRYGRTNGIAYDGRSGRSTYGSNSARSNVSGRSYGSRGGSAASGSRSAGSYSRSNSGYSRSNSGSYSRSNSGSYSRSNSGSYSRSSSGSYGSSSSRSYGGSSGGSFSRSSGGFGGGSFGGGSSHSSSSRGGGGGRR